jgi:hypothetical protein
MSKHTLHADDEALLVQLDQLVPGVAKSVRPLLENGSVAHFTLPDPQAQRIVDQIFANRMKRAREQQDAIVPPNVTFVKVLMVESLPSGDAVVRYSERGRDPVIVVPENATGPALGAAIAAVYQLRKKADELPAEGGSVVINNARMPETWSLEMQAGTEHALKIVRSKPVTTVPGIGRGRHASIPLLAG